MPDHNASPRGSINRHIAPSVIVILFALAMSACVLGVVAWKALDAKTTTLERGQIATQNLAHSLIEQAAHTIQAADISMTGIVEFLKYQTPVTERFNRYLASTVDALPQIREMGVIGPDGSWLYSSLPETPRHNNADRDYFIYHRDTVGPAATPSFCRSGSAGRTAASAAYWSLRSTTTISIRSTTGCSSAPAAPSA